jgi:hypothetical protein
MVNMTMLRAVLLTAGLGLLAGATTATAQEQPLGPGKFEIGLFPMGGMFLVGGDDDREVNFNTYTSGANVSFYFNQRAAVEGELGINLGWGQDIVFHRTEVFHVQMPNVWSYSGNIVFFPQGAAGRHLPVYLTGGVGIVSLQSREPTKPFGYDVNANPWEHFFAENVGGGVKVFRTSAPNWGFRADYRYILVNANDSAPAFFAKAKNRGGHRIYFGLFYTKKQ